ncbi:Crp/Fnr family transcriptional regulator [Brevibacillus sp. NL20B1]|jgi:CRP/FNR family transcriptional regulator, cyclic AMP receptor protein|uniref:Crp/Fnr family transcriptional regulator n=1 Tax=Brevibacillus sp. NL20B1 TaxID=2829799 RepID=UPI001B9606B0|nr:Crp/Fnr family transcriptional regulator [Brevibacillus sp. NL20B1]MBR8661060.1 Crp/Fnr family transcriptional regulator [Brevibacillus sp. NL20B1]
MIKADLAGSIRNTSCFSEGNFAKLKEIMCDNHFPAGSHLFWEGDPADKLYFLHKGRVCITKATDDGKHLVIYTHQAGDLFGQVDPFRESVHFFGAEILEDADVGIIQQQDLEALLLQHGDLAVEFMKWIGLMNRLTQSKLRDLMLFGKLGILCSLLIRLGNTYGIEQGGRILISKKLTNSELADMIGTTRESVNRILGDLKKAGVISYEDGHIVIQDLDYLRDTCQCENCPKEICRV